MQKQETGASATGNYRNLFAEYGYAEADIEHKLQDMWNQLFHGDEDTRIYYEAGEAGAYLLDTGNLDVRQKGCPIGMMIAVQLDQKDVFDRIWKWTHTNMLMTEGDNAGYFAWSCNTDGTKRSNGPAPDGEEYFALSLFFASHRWGDGETPYNYSEQARDLLRTCIHKGENGVGQPMWNPDNKLIKFVPNCEYSDPSYHLPHFYELFVYGLMKKIDRSG